MTDQLIDESSRSPGIRFWIMLVAASLVIGSTLYVSYSYLFPSQEASLALSGLAGQGSTQDTLSTSDSQAVESDKTAAPVITLISERDPVSGFQVSRPATWRIQSQDGFVLLRSDECGASTALFYPMTLLSPTSKPTELLATLTHAFIDQLESMSAKVTLGSTSSEGEGGATALLSGSVCGSEIIGSVSLVAQGNRGLLKLAWYPVSQQQQLQNTFKQILQSYKSILSTAVLQYQGSLFQVPVPDGWLFEESDQSASVHSGDRLFRVSALDFPADQSLDVALDSWIEQEQQAGRPLEGLNVQRSLEQSGDDRDLHRYNSKTRCITYQKDGTTYRGILTAAYTDALGNRALLYWRTAPQQEWYLADPTLLLIEQGALYTAIDGTERLKLPVYATWQDLSLLTGTGIRASLATAGAGLWQPLMLKAGLFTDSTGALFLAPPNAQNAQTGTYSKSKEGQSVELTPLESQGRGQQ